MAKLQLRQRVLQKRSEGLYEVSQCTKRRETRIQTRAGNGNTEGTDGDVSDILASGGIGWVLDGSKRERAQAYLESAPDEATYYERAFALVGLLGTPMNFLAPVMQTEEANDAIPSEEEQQRRREEAMQQGVNIGKNERQRRMRVGNRILVFTATCALPLATQPLLARASLLLPLFLGYGFRKSGATGL